MRRTTVLIATLCVGLLLVGTAAYAQQVKGTVINRDGAAQSGCRVDFKGPPNYSVWTNQEGAFFLDSPGHRTYTVTVTQGERSQIFENVTIDYYGLHPPTLVVNW